MTLTEALMIVQNWSIYSLEHRVRALNIIRTETEGLKTL